MAIYKGSEQVGRVFHGGQEINRVYRGDILVFEKDGGIDPGENPHEFWRARCLVGSGNIQYGEVEFYDTDDNLASIGGTAIASSQYGGFYLTAYAFDGNTGSRWAAIGNVDQWIGYQFPSPVSINKMRTYSTDQHTETMRAIALEWSNDGIEWTVYGIAVDVNQPYLNWVTVDFVEDPGAWWRIRFVATNGGNTQYAEVQFLDASDNIISTGGMGIGLSQYGGGYTIANAFDGNLSSYFAANGNTGHWIGYTKSTEMLVDKVKLYPSNFAQYATELALEYSLDYGNTWVTVGNATGLGNPAPTGTTVTFS